MPTVVIKTNPSATHTTVNDMGIVITAAGGSVTLIDREDIKLAAVSLDLVTLATDDAFGPNSSTLIINDGGQDIPQAYVEVFLASVLMAKSGPFSIPVRDANGKDTNLIGYSPTYYTPADSTVDGHLEGIDASLSTGGALPPATQVGQVLLSTDGVGFSVQLPLIGDLQGWLHNDNGCLLVVG